MHDESTEVAKIKGNFICNNMFFSFWGGFRIGYGTSEINENMGEYIYV